MANCSSNQKLLQNISNKENQMKKVFKCVTYQTTNIMYLNSSIRIFKKMKFVKKSLMRSKQLNKETVTTNSVQ